MTHNPPSPPAGNGNGNGKAPTATEDDLRRPAATPQTVLELTVNNHPGVMSHVCGLFARRAYNVEAILCLPIGDGARSRIWLLVGEDERLDQMVKQLEKLVDVLEVRRHGATHDVFERLEAYFRV